MLRRCTTILCAFGAVLFCAAVASATSYTLYDLTVSGETSSYASAINSSNVVAGRCYPSGGGSYAYDWNPTGGRTIIPALNGTGTTGVGFAINNSGLVTGLSASTTPSGNQAFSYNTNSLTNFNIGSKISPTPTSSRGYGINSSGQVTGYGGISGSTWGYFWDGNTADNATVLNGWSGTTFSYGQGVNDSGLVVGYAAATWTTPMAGTYDKPLVWQGGSYTDIDAYLQPVLTPSFVCTAGAYAVNNSGEIVGTYQSGPASGVLQMGSAFLYKDSTHIVDLGDIGTGYHAQAQSINSTGTVVGSAMLADGSTEHAFIWTPDVANGTTSSTHMIDLNSLSYAGTLPSGYYFQQALGINDAGSIVGLMYNGTTTRAFALIAPVPEPSTLLLAAAGLVALMAYAWRKQK